MAFGQISFGGLASGLNTTAIIQSLVSLERRPIRILEGQKSTEQEKLTLIGTFEGLVKKVQSRASDLLGGDFFAYSLEEGTEGVASFTLSEGAQSGAHTLKVFSLASADRYALSSSSTITDPDATGLGTGDITFTYDGTDYTVTVTAGNDSLNDIAGFINSAAGDDVTASVVNVGTKASPDYQLVLAGNDTGTDYAITSLTVGGGIDLQNGVSSTITSASNASVKIDGLAVERSSNVFADVLPGVSFTVTKAESVDGVETTFTIDSDVEGIKKNLQEFVDAYNDVIDFVNKQSEYSEDAGTGGELFGDSALRDVRRTFNNALFNPSLSTVMADTEGYSTLGLVGFDLDSDGRLSIDDSDFDEKLAGNLEAMADLFLKDDAADEQDNGVLFKLDAALDDLLKDHSATDAQGNPLLNPATNKPVSIRGLFNRRRDTLNSLIADIDKEVERLERHVEGFELSLVQRFANLESIIGGLNAQSAYLSSGNAFPSFR